MTPFHSPSRANRGQLFLRFEGPATLLLQSRASRLSDVLTLRDVDEIADSPPGAVQDAVTRKIKEEIEEIATTGTTPPVASTPPPTVKDVTIKEAKTEVAKPATKEIIV
jgi:hypothetical protein